MQNMMKDGESMLKIQPLLWFCSFVSFFSGESLKLPSHGFCLADWKSFGWWMCFNGKI